MNSKGESLRKQWRFDSTSESLVTHMAKFVCDGSHSHAIVQGSDTIKTGFYDKKVAESLLDGLGICEKRVLAATATAAPQCTQLNESATAAPQCTQ